MHNVLGHPNLPHFLNSVTTTRQGNRILSLRLLKADGASWRSGAINSDRGCRNGEEPASVRSFARSKGSSASNHLPNFSYAIALPEAIWWSVHSRFSTLIAFRCGEAARARNGRRLRRAPASPVRGSKA